MSEEIYKQKVKAARLEIRVLRKEVDIEQASAVDEKSERTIERFGERLDEVLLILADRPYGGEE